MRFRTPLFYTVILASALSIYNNAYSATTDTGKEVMQNNHTSSVATSSTTRSTLNTPSDQVTNTSQKAFIEQYILSKLKHFSKSDSDLQRMSLIYWSENHLYVLIKDSSLLPKITKSLDPIKNPSIAPYVTVGVTKYSQYDYDTLAQRFEVFYTEKAPSGHILKIFPKPSEDLLVVHVDQEYPYMLDSVRSAFGKRVQVVVPKVTAISNPPKIEPTPIHF